MRPPRFQFPDEVRSTTRDIASQMVGAGTIARTPEQLDEWIAQRPEIREPLAADGYGTDFTAEDLFPLLEVFVAKAGGPPLVAETGRRASLPRGWVLFALLAAAVVIGLVVLTVAGGTRPR